jgi:hypothetical protein
MERTHKVCTICGETKSVSDFHFTVKERGYLASRCKPCAQEYARTYNHLRRLLHPGEVASADRWEAIRRKYGITQEDYEELFAAQDGVCAICGKEESNGKLSVDHDHETGDVRGLLCRLCNLGLSYWKDDPGLLLSASQYLSGVRV